MNAIRWPDGFLPGQVDNFVSNEVIVEGLSTERVWSLLVTPERWPEYYANASSPEVEGANTLTEDRRFRFITFGFHVEGQVVEYQPPTSTEPGRIAWHGWVEGSSDERLDVHHAWLVEPLLNNRLRILTQETQQGLPARELAAETPNPMLNAHQAWLDGLVSAARGTVS